MRLELPLLAVSSIWLSMLTPALSYAADKTSVEGPILFQNLAGQDIDYPFEPDIIGEILSGEAIDWQTKVTVAPLDVELLEPKQHFIRYSVTVGSKYQQSMWLRLDFNYGGYEAEELIDLYEHRGSIPNHRLVIQERYRNRDERLRALSAGLRSGEFPDPVVNENLRLIEGLVSDPLSVINGVRQTESRYEDFMRAVELMEKTIRSGSALSPEISWRIMSLPDRASFDLLPEPQQFEVLAGFAYWFARSPNPDQQIQSRLTYAGLARTFFIRAHELALNAREPVDATDLARMLQESYKFECDAPKDAEDRDQSCFFALDDAGRFDLTFTANTYQAILSRFADELWVTSAPNPRPVTECGYRAAVAAQRAEMLKYWALYLDLADLVATKHRRWQILLEDDGPFDGKTYIAQMAERAQDILSFSQTNEMLSSTCAGVIVPQGAEDAL